MIGCEPIKAFQAIDGYKDSADLINDCRTALKDIDYKKAIELMNEGEIIDAYESLVALKGDEDSAEKADSIVDQYIIAKLNTSNVGDTILLGAYEQDNQISNGKEPVIWNVIKKDGKRVLLISQDGLDCKEYHPENVAVNWEMSSIRKWLNGEFINNAFSKNEQKVLSSSKITADKNPEYDTNPGNPTNDKVLLLSIKELEQYLPSKKCTPTAYAVANGAVEEDGNCYWWLRTPGGREYMASLVITPGYLSCMGNVVDNKRCVRPALWISLDH